MKSFLPLIALLGFTIAEPQFKNNRFNAGPASFSQQPQYNQPPPQQNYRQQQVVPIVSYTNDQSIDGSYQYSYQTGDGISAQAVGSVRPTGAKNAENSVATSVQGSYSYTAPDGQVITVNYIADENGYRAEGAHLPTPPPIPVEIAKSLDFIQAAQRNNPPQQQQQYNQNRFG